MTHYPLNPKLCVMMIQTEFNSDKDPKNDNRTSSRKQRHTNSSFLWCFSQHLSATLLSILTLTSVAIKLGFSVDRSLLDKFSFFSQESSLMMAAKIASFCCFVKCVMSTNIFMCNHSSGQYVSVHSWQVVPSYFYVHHLTVSLADGHTDCLSLLTG